MSTEAITTGGSAAGARGTAPRNLYRRSVPGSEKPRIPELGPGEKLLVAAGADVGDAVFRFVIGFMTLPAAVLISGRNSSWGVLAIVLLIVLLILRVAGLALRKLVPFSREASRIWAERRDLAKRYDSYQWRKLFWIGLGLASYSILSGQWRTPALQTASIAVSSFCLLSGGTGLAIWRSKRRTINRLVNQQDS